MLLPFPAEREHDRGMPGKMGSGGHPEPIPAFHTVPRINNRQRAFSRCISPAFQALIISFEQPSDFFFN